MIKIQRNDNICNLWLHFGDARGRVMAMQAYQQAHAFPNGAYSDSL